MFGYVGIYKDELKIKDYNIYKAYYCGLCKRLGKLFSQSVRMGLSYDLAFLALVLSSVSDKNLKINQERCVTHLIRKRPVLKDDQFLDYAAYMSIIITYFKLKDDINDNHKIKSFIAILFYRRHLKKAKRNYPKEFLKIKENLDMLNQYEKNNSKEIDEVADLFGEILKVLFAPSFLDCDKITKRALENFGYNIGRFIYIADAVNDVEEDIKNKTYNPILLYFVYKDQDLKEFKNKYIEKQEFSLTLTLDSIAKAFELMNFKKNRNLIENIVYLGLRNNKDRALKGMVK